MESEPDHRALLALGAVLLLVAAAFAVPASRAFLVDDVLGPVRTQADPEPGLASGYTALSLAFWALVGGAFAWVAYDVVFARLRLAPDRRCFVALAPFLLFGPLFHALLVARAIPLGTPLAYLAAEPPVYLTTAALALAGFVAGHFAARRPHEGALVVGALALLPLAWLAFTHASAPSMGRALALLAIAVAAALTMGALYLWWRPAEPRLAVFAVVGAHALDGATTWMVLRDPLGLGFHSFAEKNPISLRLVELSNGWPYFAIKLVLPVLLLAVVRVEEGQERLHAFLLLAIFVLGYGPGMSNLLQVLFA